MRLKQAWLKAAIPVAEQLGQKAEARSAEAQLKALDKKVALACAPKRVTIARLPLGFVIAPPGNASKLTFDAGERWRPTITTRAGAASGVVFTDPATIELPRGIHLESPLHADPGSVLVAVAQNAELTVEEREPGKGAWKIVVKQPPRLVPLAEVPELAEVPALAAKGAVPERGRAVLLGEWQFGGSVVLELGDEELGDLPATPSGAPHVEVTLDLSAPLPGISDGNKLPVSFESNLQRGTQGTGVRLAEECGTDATCDKARLDVEVWWDRVFGVPFVRVPSMPSTATITGRVTDRLSRPVAGQRIMATVGNRRAVTVSDSDGIFRFVGIGVGEVELFPVARKFLARPRADLMKTVLAGLGETKAPTLLIDKLFE